MSDFSDNKAKGRFEYKVGDLFAYADYRREGKVLYIDYVEAPMKLRGTGAAGRLMEHIVAVAKQEQLAIEPICGYAAHWLRRHPS
jgi:predicted GNAT family acetyltransferase